MKRTRALSLLFLLLLLPFSAHAQQTARITGMVKTTAGEAFPFANILLISSADTTKVYGGSTNEEGKFSVGGE